jgi:Tfp pilus assembly protein PilF
MLLSVGDKLCPYEILAPIGARVTARNNLGLQYLRAGKTAAAIPVLEEAARLLPDSARTHANLACAYFR